MTVDSLYTPAEVAISGTDYEFNFPVGAETDLLVYTVDANDDATALVYNVDYIVTLDEGNLSGTVQTGSYVAAVWTPAEPSGVTIQIHRSTSPLQDTDIPVRGGFRESAIEGALDKIIRIVQEQAYTLEQAIDVDPTAIQSTVAAAQVAQIAAEAAQAAAEAAQAAAEAAATAAIDEALDTSSGHDHDGVNSKTVLVTNLDVTGITDGQFIRRNGSALEGTPIRQVFTSSGTFTVPAGKTKILITLVGGGGGGGEGSAGSTGGGGGGGGATVFRLAYDVTPAAEHTVTIGAGGAGGSGGPGNDGEDGEDSVFDDGGSNPVTAPGGGGGQGNGTAGTAGGASLSLDGSNTNGGDGAVYAGGAGAANSSSNGGGGGATLVGDGADGGISADGDDAAANSGGGGGGGGSSNLDGGAGGSGICIIEFLD